MPYMTIELLIIFLLFGVFALMLYVYFSLKAVIRDLIDVQRYIDATFTLRKPNRPAALEKYRDPDKNPIGVKYTDRSAFPVKPKEPAEKPIGVRTHSGKFIPVMSEYWNQKQEEVDFES